MMDTEICLLQSTQMGKLQNENKKMPNTQEKCTFILGIGEMGIKQIMIILHIKLEKNNLLDSSDEKIRGNQT